MLPVAVVSVGESRSLVKNAGWPLCLAAASLRFHGYLLWAPLFCFNDAKRTRGMKHNRIWMSLTGLRNTLTPDVQMQTVAAEWGRGWKRIIHLFSTAGLSRSPSQLRFITQDQKRCSFIWNRSLPANHLGWHTVLNEIALKAVWEEAADINNKQTVFELTEALRPKSQRGFRIHVSVV